MKRTFFKRATTAALKGNDIATAQEAKGGQQSSDCEATQSTTSSSYVLSTMQPYSRYSAPRVVAENARRNPEESDEITPARSAAAGFLRDLLSSSGPSTSPGGGNSAFSEASSSSRGSAHQGPQPCHGPPEPRPSHEREEYYPPSPHPPPNHQVEGRQRYVPSYRPQPHRMYPSERADMHSMRPMRPPRHDYDERGMISQTGSWEERPGWDRHAAPYMTPRPPMQRWDESHQGSYSNPPPRHHPEPVWSSQAPYEVHRPRPPATIETRTTENLRGGKDVRYVFGGPAERPPSSVPSVQQEPDSDVSSSDKNDSVKITCTCKKSKCLKLYCQCFAGKMMCNSECRCFVCFNTAQHEQARMDAIKTILGRNPSAFETKFKPMSATKAEPGSDISSNVAHKLGCKCRKSACLKKYCECYNAKVKCSSTCRCVGCQNIPPGGTRKSNGIGEGITHTLPRETSAAFEPHTGGSERRAGEHVVGAAQNLAFLKHDSSPEKSETSISEMSLLERSEKLAIPPLNDRDRGGNPVHVAPIPQSVSSRPKVPPLPPDTEEREGRSKISPNDSNDPVSEKSPKKNVNALLMAAYAMTELHTGGSEPSTPTKQVEESCGETSEPVHIREHKLNSTESLSDDEYMRGCRKTSNLQGPGRVTQDELDCGRGGSPPKRRTESSATMYISDQLQQAKVISPNEEHKAKRSRLLCEE